MSDPNPNKPLDYSGGAPYPSAPAPYQDTQYPAYTYPGDPSAYPNPTPSAPPPAPGSYMPPEQQAQVYPSSYQPSYQSPYQPSYQPPSYPAGPDVKPYPVATASNDATQPVYAQDANGNVYALSPGTKIEPGQQVLISADMKKPKQIIDWGPNPMDIICPECGKNIRTKTSRRFNMDGWVIFFVLLFVTFCIFPPVILCLLVPFCVKSFYDTTHYCPQCKANLGTKKNSSF